MGDKIDVPVDNVSKSLSKNGIRKVESCVAKIYLDNRDLYKSNKISDSLIHDISLEEASEVVESILGHTSPELGEILRIFELMSENRDVNGIYYSPSNVTQYVVSNTVNKNDKVLDLACGGGAFLLEATRRLYKNSEKSVVEILEDNIHGVDIIENNVRQCKILLSLFAAENNESPADIDFKIYAEDSLKANWDSLFNDIDGFDSIVSNPPYVKIQHFSKDYKEYILKTYSTVEKGNFNLYIPFIELSLNLINDNGRVGLITPLNYFTTITGRTLREYLQENKLVKGIIDFEDKLLFDDVLVYTAITIFDKKRKSHIEYARVKDKIENLESQDMIKINYTSLDSTKWRLLNETEYSNIQKIESFQPLSSISDIHTGIATLKDAIYTIENTTENGEYYTKEFEGEEYQIEKDVTRELVKISEIDSQKELEENSRKIIFPYKKETEQMALDNTTKKNSYVEIPPQELEDKYPRTYEYFEATRDKLATREKGDGAEYTPWYRYGRKQGINYNGERLYIGTYSNGPQFVYHNNENAFFSNGYGVFPQSEDPRILQKVLNSIVMDYYMKKTSKDIQGGYQCYQKNFIKTFSVPKFTDEEEKEILESDKGEVEELLINKYNLEQLNQ